MKTPFLILVALLLVACGGPPFTQAEALELEPDAEGVGASGGDAGRGGGGWSFGSRAGTGGGGTGGSAAGSAGALGTGGDEPRPGIGGAGGVDDAGAGTGGSSPAGTGGGAGVSGTGGLAGTGGTAGSSGAAGTGGGGRGGLGGQAGAGGSPVCLPAELEKVCGGWCVRFGPENGCGSSDCMPCTAPADAVAVCATEYFGAPLACNFECVPGYRRTATGCEAP